MNRPRNRRLWLVGGQTMRERLILASVARACGHRLVRSLLSFPPVQPLPQGSCKGYPMPMETRLSPVTAGLSLHPCHHGKPKQQCIYCNRDSDTSQHNRLTGTLWSHREPAALRSSPAHMRSWQAPCDPGRARKRQAPKSHLPEIGGSSSTRK